MIYSLEPHNIQLGTTLCPPYAWWDGGFTEEDLAKLDDMFKNSKLDKGVVGTGDGAAGGSRVDLNIRNSDVGFKYTTHDDVWFLDRVKGYINSLNRDYYRFDLRAIECMQFTTYNGDEKGHYGWHTDSGFGLSTNNTRKLSFVMFMSNPSEYEGGQFQILIDNDPINVEQIKGRIVVFPSHTLHRVTPVTKGIRKSIVTWSTGPLFV